MLIILKYFIKWLIHIWTLKYACEVFMFPTIMMMVVLILNMFCAFLKKYNRIIIILTVIFIVLLFSGSYNNPDYLVYLNEYSNDYKNNLFFSNKEYGFYYITRFFYLLGFSYNQFLVVLTIVCFALITTTVRTFIKNNSSLFFVLYIIYPFFLDIVQIRNFIVMSILIYASHFLLNNDLKGKAKFLLCIIIASSFQLIAILYLPLLFATQIKNRKVQKILFAIFLSFLILVSFNNSFIDYISNFIIKYSNIEKMEFIFSKRVNFGFLIPFLLQIFISIFLTISKKIIDNGTNFEDNSLEIQYFNLIYAVNIISYLYIPFYMISSNFIRILRNLIPLYYIALIIGYENTKLGTLKRSTYFIFLVILALMQFGYFIFLGYSNSIIVPIMTKNLFI